MSPLHYSNAIVLNYIIVMQYKSYVWELRQAKSKEHGISKGMLKKPQSYCVYFLGTCYSYRDSQRVNMQPLIPPPTQTAAFHTCLHRRSNTHTHRIWLLVNTLIISWLCRAAVDVFVIIVYLLSNQNTSQLYVVHLFHIHVHTCELHPSTNYLYLSTEMFEEHCSNFKCKCCIRHMDDTSSSNWRAEQQLYTGNRATATGNRQLVLSSRVYTTYTRWPMLLIRQQTLITQCWGVVEQTTAMINNICLQLGEIQQVQDMALFTRQYPECTSKGFNGHEIECTCMWLYTCTCVYTWGRTFSVMSNFWNLIETVSKPIEGYDCLPAWKEGKRGVDRERRGRGWEVGKAGGETGKGERK